MIKMGGNSMNQVVWSSQATRGCVIPDESVIPIQTILFLTWFLYIELWCPYKNIYTSWHLGFSLTGPATLANTVDCFREERLQRGRKMWPHTDCGVADYHIAPNKPIALCTQTKLYTFTMHIILNVSHMTWLMLQTLYTAHSILHIQ